LPVRAIQENVNPAYKRIRPVLKAFLARHHVSAAVSRSNCDDLDAGHVLGLWHDGPRDAVAIVRELVFQHVLKTETLLGAILVGDHLAAALHILAEVRVPFVAVLEDLPLEKPRGARGRVAVGLDRLVRPFAREPELAPGADVLVRAARVGWRPL